jgi:hypothetical protein
MDFLRANVIDQGAETALERMIIMLNLDRCTIAWAMQLRVVWAGSRMDFHGLV